MAMQTAANAAVAAAGRNGTRAAVAGLITASARKHKKCRRNIAQAIFPGAARQIRVSAVARSPVRPFGPSWNDGTLHDRRRVLRCRWASGLLLGLERRDTSLECLVLLAREAGRLLDGLELLAPHDVEIAQNALSLAAEQRVELAPHARGDAGGVVHQPRHLVEKPVGRLGHAILQPRLHFLTQFFFQCGRAHLDPPSLPAPPPSDLPGATKCPS